MKKKVKIGIICCNYTNLADEVDYKLLPCEVIVERVPCGGFIKSVNILRMFELGADGVIVVTCKDCHNKEGNIRGYKKALEVREVVSSMGFEPERVEGVFVERLDTGQFLDMVKKFCKKIQELEA